MLIILVQILLDFCICISFLLKVMVLKILYKNKIKYYTYILYVRILCTIYVLLLLLSRFSRVQLCATP